MYAFDIILYMTQLWYAFTITLKMEEPAMGSEVEMTRKTGNIYFQKNTRVVLKIYNVIQFKFNCII